MKAQASSSWGRLLLAAVPAGVLLHGTAAAQPSQDYFPLAQGTSWTYAITDESQAADTDNIIKEEAVQEMTVKERLRNGAFELAVIRSCVRPVRRKDAQEQCGEHITAWKNGTSFYNIAINDDFNKLTRSPSYLASKATPDSLFLVTPLKKGMEFGRDPELEDRKDSMYEWYVEDEGARTLERIEGVSPKKKYTVYTLVYRTNPDHQQVEYAPFVGVLSATSIHHGTVMNSYKRLTRFRPGRGKKAGKR